MSQISEDKLYGYVLAMLQLVVGDTKKHLVLGNDEWAGVTKVLTRDTLFVSPFINPESNYHFVSQREWWTEFSLLMTRVIRDNMRLKHPVAVAYINVTESEDETLLVIDSITTDGKPIVILIDVNDGSWAGNAYDFGKQVNTRHVSGEPAE